MSNPPSTVEIHDRYIRLYIFSLFFIIFMGGLCFFGIFAILRSPNDPYTPAIIIEMPLCVAVFGFIYWAAFHRFHFRHRRKCVLSRQGIEFSIPPNRSFRINWNDFDSLQVIVTPNPPMIMGGVEGLPAGMGKIIELNFLLHQTRTSQEFKFLMGVDFHRKKVAQILYSIKFLADPLYKVVRITTRERRLRNQLEKIYCGRIFRRDAKLLPKDIEHLKWDILSLKTNGGLRTFSVNQLENLIVHDRNNDVLWQALGDAYIQAGRFQEAAQSYQRALHIKEHHLHGF